MTAAPTANLPGRVALVTGAAKTHRPRPGPGAGARRGGRGGALRPITAEAESAVAEITALGPPRLGDQCRPGRAWAGRSADRRRPAPPLGASTCWSTTSATIRCGDPLGPDAGPVPRHAGNQPHRAVRADPAPRCRALAPGTGQVINLGYAGVEHLVANTRAMAYQISKAGLLVLTRSLAQALGPRGVRVNMVSPGHIDNSVDLPADIESHVPLGRPAQVRRHRRRACCFCSRRPAPTSPAPTSKWPAAIG